MKSSILRYPTIVAALLLILAAPAGAQIVTDTSLGRPAQNLTGPGYTIPESLGRLAGGNLFHSFQTFNIGQGEHAFFTTTTPTINNVISRVTGGTPSTINGPIFFVAADGRPDFYFINPAGVIFGAGAFIDVPGAFHVSTADYVSFLDGRFYADPTKASTFSSATPEAFGFLGERRTPISLSDGADLMAYPDQDITLVAGDIGIDSSRVKSNGGRLRLAALGQQAIEVPFAGELPSGDGSLNIVRNGLLSVTDSCCFLAGSIKISAGDVLLDSAGGPANNTGIFGSTLDSSISAASFDIAASNSIIVREGATIAARSRSAGTGGSINIRSPLVEIDNATIDVSALSDGKAGSVSINGNMINLIDGGQIWSSAQSTGDAGSITLSARDSIDIGKRDSEGNVSSVIVQSSTDAAAGQVVLISPRIRLYDDGKISAYASSRGTTGSVDITTQNMTLENGGVIYSYGLYTPGGRVTITASDNLLIRGKSEGPNASPGADMVSTGIIGHGTQITINSPTIMISESGAIRSENWYQASPGYINITTQRLDLQSGAEISGNALGHSYTDGIGAPIHIKASEYVHVDGSSNGRYSRIASAARSSGDAGSIYITTPGLRISNGANLNSGTGRFGTAGAGMIELTVDHLEILSNGSLQTHEQGHAAVGGHISILARDSINLDSGQIIATGRNEAAAGKITITTPSLTLRNAVINALTDEYAISGGIEINTDTLSMQKSSQLRSDSTSVFAAGNISLNIYGLTFIENSSITTASSYAGGGNITLRGKTPDTNTSAFLMRNALLTTSVKGPMGDGGDINIRARALALDTGFIQANTVATNAAGGNINIDVGSLLPSGNILFVGGQTPYEFQSGLANFNVIQAAAPTGINGAINISSLALDISGSLVGLNTGMIEIGGLGRSPCQPTAGSSLVQVGRGGFPPSARNLLSSDALMPPPPAPEHLLPATSTRQNCP